MPDGQSRTLKTPTYLGLVLSQFLAAFNDQAAHIIAVFYAGDMLVRYAKVSGIDEKTVVFIVPACFVAPFFLFSPLAGVLADKYSKRNIIVLWKMVEVAIMAVALIGFLLPQLATMGMGDPRTLAIWSAVLIISTVFLMGTHSAFFVPAKYGIMPEILHPAILSKGNGFLEGTSFLAQILGTSFGGLLYGPLKPTFSGGELQAGNAWIIGVVLFILALIGAVASLVMGKVAPAAGDRAFTLNPFGPLANNLRVVRKSRPLVLAVLGIAFFTSMTLFLRQGLLYEGETSKDLHAARRQKQMADAAAPKTTPLPGDRDGDGIPDDEDDDTPPGASEAAAFVPDASEAQQAELRVALLVAYIGLGVGIGSWLAGYLSGAKVELGLVPIGAAFIALATAGLSAVTQDGGSTWPTTVCLILIGIAAGLYIVPLYTLLQHRAPKQSKGSLVATSNFLNSTAGLVAVAAFFVITSVLERVLGLSKQLLESITDPTELIAHLQHQFNIPRLLFLTGAIMTVVMIFVLRRILPDFFLRSALWLRNYGRVKITLQHVQHVPGAGGAILLTNAPHFTEAMHVVSATDRKMKFIVVEEHSAANGEERSIRFFARRAGYQTAAPGALSADRLAPLREEALATTREGNVLAVAMPDGIDAADVERLIDEVRRTTAAPLILIAYDQQAATAGKTRHVRLTVSEPIAANISTAAARLSFAAQADAA